MKSILLIVIPLVVIIGMGIFIQSMLDQNANEITSQLDKLEELVYRENWEQAAADMKQISKTWQPVRRKWEALIDHAETDRIDDSFARLKAYVKAEEDEECLAEIEALKQNFQHIPEKERLSISNIF